MLDKNRRRTATRSRDIDPANPPALTARQRQILDWIRSYLETTGMPPTRAEIATGLGFSTPSSAEDHLQALARKGSQAALDEAGRHRIAVHEAGHAIVAKLLQVGIVEKVSILKRGHALGVTLVTDDEDVILQSEAQWRARMLMLLAGRGAESLLLGSISTGAANDLERVSGMAYRMVAEFGFSRRIGPFSYAGLPDRERRLAECPEVVAEAREIVKDLERECDLLLTRQRAGLERLTTALLEHETVSGEIVMDCLETPARPSDMDGRSAAPTALAA